MNGGSDQLEEHRAARFRERGAPSGPEHDLRVVEEAEVAEQLAEPALIAVIAARENEDLLPLPIRSCHAVAPPSGDRPHQLADPPILGPLVRELTIPL